MQRKVIPESQIKLLILYSLDKLGPVSSVQLLHFLVENDLMNYFELQLNLPSLLEQEQVAEKQHPMAPLLVLTEEGINTIGMFKGKIPVSRRETVDNTAMQWKIRFLGEQQMLTESFHLPDGRICNRFQLLEKDTALLDMMILFDHSEQPDRLSQRWIAIGSRFYKQLMDHLSGGFSQKDASSVSDFPAGLEQLSDSSWLLSLQDNPADPVITLILTLPTQAMAIHFRDQWENVRTNIVPSFKALLADSIK